MFQKYVIVVYFWLNAIVSCQRSFTVVLDTTVSMQDELDVIKMNLGPVINSISDRITIDNYILVPFNDDVQQPLIAITPRDLLSWLNIVRASGGKKCPENSLAAIEKALQISKSQSHIFVFTDAYSKDADKFEVIQNLCRSTNSQVYIFLSGSCLESTTSTAGSLDVYYDVASACSGAVVRLDLSHLKQAFKFMKAVTELDWTDVYSYSFADYKEFKFTADSFTEDILLVVSGEAPKIGITNAEGQHQRNETLVESKNMQLLSLRGMDVGVKTVSIRCRGLTSATLFTKRHLPIEYGFSTKPPRSMNETALRPIPGTTNYILINITQPTLKLQNIEIQVLDEGERKPLNVEEKGIAGLYMTKTLVDPDKTFRIWINCIDTSTLMQNQITGSTKYMTPQTSVLDPKWIKPTSEIMETGSITVEYGNNRLTACKVTGYPKPMIWWEDTDGVALPSEDVLLIIPSVYISYVTIENVTTNSTIYCKSKNKEGEDSQSLDVFFHRTHSFQMKQTPTDITIQYGNEGKLLCEVEAYPEAETKWYHNHKLVTEVSDLQITFEDNALVINNMTLDDVGDYKCQVTNEDNDESYSAYVNISGIEKPKIGTEKSTIVLKLGDWSTLECRVLEGKPAPRITWQYKKENDVDYGDIPNGVVVEADKLKMASTQIIHQGVYKCEATNVLGTDSAEIQVELKYAPIIAENFDRTMEVREGSPVELVCSARGSPKPSVRWQRSQGNALVPLEPSDHTDGSHTHRFNALWRDSGDYHCIAENELGSAKKTVTVNVLVPVYIEPPASKTIVLKTGASVILNCKILFGNPAPSTRWEFMGIGSTTTVLSRDNKLFSTLHLNNVSRINEGSYFCISENDFSSDSIKINVKVN